jgi:D-alanyl-lipoteichoic acid acyltransferase DltB (MBOAT superfamily)
MFSIQLYADFSGYSDIARGVSRLFGIELMVNFQQPYLSRNITEFWRRWHISLSTWLRDYLYISLGGNRRGLTITYLNLMITMLMVGLWHGASWNFVLWGGMHGIYLAVHRSFRNRKEISSGAASGIFRPRVLCSIFFTNILVILTFVFFPSDRPVHRIDLSRRDDRNFRKHPLRGPVPCGACGLFLDRRLARPCAIP